MSNYKISNRAFINDANYRIMLFIDDKLRKEGFVVNSSEYNNKYNLIFEEMTKKISLERVLSMIENLYNALFENAFAESIEVVNKRIQEEFNKEESHDKTESAENETDEIITTENADD